MKLRNARILVTGASGGIGHSLALALAREGALLMLAGREGDALSAICGEISALGANASPFTADLMQPGAAEQLATDAVAASGGVDVLVNLAGISSFRLFQEEDSASIERLWRVNVIAPMILSRCLLPQMLGRGSGRIVNIGSVFGSIGFACFANYSATKFAIRGFSQALRRELENTGIGVTYVAPRYTRTPINAGAVSRMASALKMNMDEPSLVADHIVRAIARDHNEHYIGFPESLFIRINALLPGLVDGAMRTQNRRMRTFAEAR